MFDSGNALHWLLVMNFLKQLVDPGRGVNMCVEWLLVIHLTRYTLNVNVKLWSYQHIPAPIHGCTQINSMYVQICINLFLLIFSYFFGGGGGGGGVSFITE